MGNDLRVIGEDIVNQAAVVGVERADLEGLAGGFDPLGDALDFLCQLVFLDGAEMLAVHLDALGLGQVAAEDAVDEVLQVVEAVAVLADERLAVARVDLQARAVDGFPAARWSP